jgi:hypothetical protein
MSAEHCHVMLGAVRYGGHDAGNLIWPIFSDDGRIEPAQLATRFKILVGHRPA